MEKSKIKALKQLNITLDENKIKTFENYMQIFLEKNSHINLISKNDAEFLFEKHIFDSLAINKVFTLKNMNIKGKTLLDIGTGGGFPSVPIAILYDDLNIYGIDSINKKIKVIEQIKLDLHLENLHLITDRVENIHTSYDYVTTRAVAPLKKILEYAIPILKKGGYFIAYKSKNIQEELTDAKNIIKKSKIKHIDTIEYTLPLDEIYERNLLIFQKQ